MSEFGMCYRRFARQAESIKPGQFLISPKITPRFIDVALFVIEIIRGHEF